ncbi:MaoC family dehydratase [Marinoscillum sp. MHG1-6]|uniref:MaoC family dehydratase n=1 Tax=Marinoscillum sp. MHG1-6 TaxID=2959627 RepID=UPI0021589D36|nr:MaoC family dehydratase [Marinoscillum sp. MHG1-6]
MIVVGSYEEFEKYIGEDMGVSEYLKVTQEQINKFAEATLDHQWIHCDEEKAKNGPFGTTIAHGYLTLSLVPYLWGQILEAKNLKMMINYGVDNLKFGAPVPVGSELRLHAKLDKLTNLRGITKAEFGAKMEIKDNPKAAFTATLILLYHFE